MKVNGKYRFCTLKNIDIDLYSGGARICGAPLQQMNLRPRLRRKAKKKKKLSPKMLEKWDFFWLFPPIVNKNVKVSTFLYNFEEITRKNQIFPTF